MSQTKEKKFSLSQQEMMDRGVHLGHRTSKLHPRMKPFVVGIRNTVHVIDLSQTEKLFNDALNMIANLIEEKKILLFVGTKIPLRAIVKQTAQDCKMPFVINRWLGGTFTNFPVIQKRAQYFKDMQKKKESGEFEKYTKKEQAGLDKEYRDLEAKFEGIQNMDKLPDAVFICDIIKDDLPLKEAKMKGIPVLALIDTNADPSQVDYPIPSNDDAISSVSYMLDKIKEVILDSQK